MSGIHSASMVVLFAWAFMLGMFFLPLSASAVLESKCVAVVDSQTLQGIDDDRCQLAVAHSAN